MKKIIAAAIFIFLCAGVFAQPVLSAEQKEGTDYYKTGKIKDAITSFKKALVKDPNALYSLNALGNLYLLDNDNNEAYAVADKGLKISANAVNFVALKAKAAIAINKPGESIIIIDAYLQKHDADFMILFVKGNAYAALGDQPQAIGAYSKSIALNAEFPDAYLQRAKLFAELERYPNALKDYDHYISLEDDNADAYNMRGMIYYKTKMLNEAIADFNKSILLNPKQQYALANRGVAYRDMNETVKALSDLNASSAVDPSYSNPYFEKAILYDRQKNYNAAFEMISRAVELQPSWSVYTGEQSKIMLALDKNTEGLAAAKKTILLDAKNPDGYLYETVAYYNMEKFDDAIEAATSGIAAIPDYYVYYSLRASAYRKKGNSASADADDQKAKELSTH